MKYINKDIPFYSGTIVSSEGSNNYSFIFEDIANAKHLYISTFNYYMSDDDLEKLKKHSKTVLDIRVVFNVFSSDKINDIIKNSIKRNPYVQLYFNENNHSKIISTGNQLYLGSANYSGYSKNNFEVGIKINDNMAINQIENKIFNNLLSYCPIITDPIQAILVSSIIMNDYIKTIMEWLEWFYDKGKDTMFLSVGDITYIEVDELNEFVNATRYCIDIIRKFISNNSSQFNEEGIEINLLLENISTLIKYDNLCIGASTKQNIDVFIEDYSHAMPKYKESIWHEFFLKETNRLLSREREICGNISAIVEILIYTRMKWIDSFKGTYKEHYYLSKVKGVIWKINTDWVREAIQALI